MSNAITLHYIFVRFGLIFNGITFLRTRLKMLSVCLNWLPTHHFYCPILWSRTKAVQQKGRAHISISMKWQFTQLSLCPLLCCPQPPLDLATLGEIFFIQSYFFTILYTISKYFLLSQIVGSGNYLNSPAPWLLYVLEVPSTGAKYTDRKKGLLV